MRIRGIRVLILSVGLLLYLDLAGCSQSSSEPGESQPAASGVVTGATDALSESDTAKLDLSGERIVYVPVYSHINTGNARALFNLAVTLAVRNTDAETPLILTALDYYDTTGRKARTWLERPVRLAPMSAFEVYIRENDTSGGLGASFRVRWVPASERQSAPVIQAVHAGTASAQGISFVTEGVALRGEER